MQNDHIKKELDKLEALERDAKACANHLKASLVTNEGLQRRIEELQQELKLRASEAVKFQDAIEADKKEIAEFKELLEKANKRLSSYEEVTYEKELTVQAETIKDFPESIDDTKDFLKEELLVNLRESVVIGDSKDESTGNVTIYATLSIIKQNGEEN